MRKSLKKVIALGLAAAMVAGIGSGATTPNVAEAGQIDISKISTERPYYGYLCFQTGTSWSFRNPVDDDTYGILPSSLVTTEGKSEYVKGWTDYASTFVWNEATELKADGTPKTYTKVAYQPTVKNPDISYDGTYTASISDFGDAFKYEQAWNMVYVSTNIPRSNTDVKFSDVSLSVDGNVVYQAAEAVLREKADSPNLWTIMGICTYNNLVADSILTNYPKQSISMTFTVSGLGAKPEGYVDQSKDYNKPADPTSGVQNVSTNASLSAINAQVPTPPSVTSLEKGETFTSGNLTYKVLKASEESGSATVAVSGVKSKTKTSFTIPKTVTNEEFEYQVTAINSKAFAKCKKLKTVTIGANVKTIKANAFASCTKLATLKIKGKLTKAAKNAFKGCKKTIKVSGSSKKANIKILKKSGYKKFK